MPGVRRVAGAGTADRGGGPQAAHERSKQHGLPWRLPGRKGGSRRRDRWKANSSISAPSKRRSRRRWRTRSTLARCGKRCRRRSNADRGGGLQAAHERSKQHGLPRRLPGRRAVKSADVCGRQERSSRHLRDGGRGGGGGRSLRRGERGGGGGRGRGGGRGGGRGRREEAAASAGGDAEEEEAAAAAPAAARPTRSRRSDGGSPLVALPMPPPLSDVVTMRRQAPRRQREEEEEEQQEEEESEGEVERCGCRTERDGGFDGCILPFGHDGPHDLGLEKRQSRRRAAREECHGLQRCLPPPRLRL